MYLHNLLDAPLKRCFTLLCKVQMLWIWNLHRCDFDSHTSDLEEISRKVFSAHFGQLGILI
jgi:hypothetical protein